MKERLWRINYFLLPLLAYIIIGVITTIVYGKYDLHRFLVQFHTTPFDIFFKNITYFGNSITPIVVILLLLFIKYRYAIMVLIGVLLSLIISSLLKFVFFVDALRPLLFFEQLGKTEDLHYVEGIIMRTNFSFPSGHSITIVMLMTIFSLITNKRSLQIIFVVIAILTSYSRIYLSQHFVIDAVIGSLLGLLIGLISYFVMVNRQKSWLDKSILH